jgi:hypothetical protein
MTDDMKTAFNLLWRACSETCDSPPCQCADDIAAALKAARGEWLRIPDEVDTSKAPFDGDYVHTAIPGRILEPLAWMYSPNAGRWAFCGVVHGVALPHQTQPTHYVASRPLPAPPVSP